MRSEPARAKRRAIATRLALIRAVGNGDAGPDKLRRLADASRNSELLLAKARLYHAREDLLTRRPEHEVEQIKRQIDKLNTYIVGLQTMSIESYINVTTREAPPCAAPRKAS